MKTEKLTANSPKEARELIAELFAGEYNDGDRVEVTIPSGDKLIYVFTEFWEIKEVYKEFLP